MAKSTSNTGKPWSPQDEGKLKDLAKRNKPTRIIGMELRRTEAAIYAKAKELHVSLKPVNQSPYNRRAKPKK